MSRAPSWIAAVWLLLKVARRRARAQVHANIQRRRIGSAGLVYGFTLVASLIFQGLLAACFIQLANTATNVALEADGKFVVSGYLIQAMDRHEDQQRAYRDYEEGLGRSAKGNDEKWFAEVIAADRATAKRNFEAEQEYFSRAFETEARYQASKRGGNQDVLRQQLSDRYASQGRAAFVAASRTFAAPSDPVANSVLTVLIGCWWLSLVLQGEGMMLDTMRRRHPMWEWYLSFPIPQSALFTAEALVPVISNPFLLLSPVLPAVLIGVQQGSVAAGVFGLFLGLPLMLAAAIWAKALEVLIQLRSSVRNRSAWLALCSGLGLAATFLPMVLLQAPKLARTLIGLVVPLAHGLPSAQHLLDAGTLPDWLRAVSISVLISACFALPAYLALRFAVARGLEGGFGESQAPTDKVAFRAQHAGRHGWLSDPLLQKEWLWLKRDRGALIQLIGVPLLLVALQFFNLQNLMREVEVTWHKLAGLVVGLGGYVLFVSGPRALLSEGPALALTMTWPRSLEDTLRMKVRLLFALASAMVWLCLLVLMWMFPSDSLKLALVALAWPIFGLSVAEKAVTLIRKPSDSGESEPLPQSQIWMAGLGNLTFAIGVFTAQWQIAIAAIVMNWVFAGALWQGFRFRLAYLFDPDSQPEMRPPTVLSSVIAVVGYMEFGTFLGVPLLFFFGEGGAPFAMAIGYGLAAAGVSLVVWHWNEERGVTLGDIFRLDEGAPFFPIGVSLAAIALGALLGLVGIGYQTLLLHAPWPEIQEPLARSMKFFAESSKLRYAYAILAIGIVPWFEEFIFRGLMFRAMQSQWTLSCSVLASSAFFAVLHPVTAWPMVFALGAFSALFFHRARALFPCILLHMTYNATLIGLM